MQHDGPEGLGRNANHFAMMLRALFSVPNHCHISRKRPISSDNSQLKLKVSHKITYRESVSDPRKPSKS